MAYVKKADRPVEESTENVEEKVTDIPKEVTNGGSEADQRIAALEAQIKMLTALLQATNAGQQAQNSLTEEVTVVHLVSRAPGLTTHIELSTITLDLCEFGEERTLDRRQAEELAGKYRSLFENGTLAFGRGAEKMATKFRLKTVQDYSYLSTDFINRLAIMDFHELEDLYGKLCDGHRAFIIEYFKRKIAEGKDPRFSDPIKIETLNRISNGAMESVLVDAQNKHK